MNKFQKIKYIIVDLDDTLLNHEKKISGQTIRVLRKAQRYGYKIIFNTSRSLQNSIQFAEKVKIDYGIFSGGCHIVDSEYHDLFSDTMSVKKVNSLLKQLKDICPKISVQTKTTFFASDREYKNQNAQYFDVNKPFKEEAYKIMCFSNDHDKIESIANENNLEYQNYLGRGWHRLSVKGANKWNGVLHLLKYLKGKPDECMCFGDDSGDLDMILNAGVGVAMNNSRPAVLEKAPFVTSSNDEDGVARFIEHFLFDKTVRYERYRKNVKVKKAFKLKKKNKTLPRRQTPEEMGLANYTLAQELWNAISHGVGAVFGIVAMVLLLIKTFSNPSGPLFVMKLINAIYYPSTIIICMTISTVYHSLAKNRGKKVLRVLDHAMIYLLVAGSYAPYCLIAMVQKEALLWMIPNTTWSAYLILGICYACIITGAALSSANMEKFKIVAFILYLVGGLTVLINITGIYQALDLWGFILLALGGVFYVVGSVLYAIGKKKSIWWHTVFHFFVLLGIVSMFISIYMFVY